MTDYIVASCLKDFGMLSLATTPLALHWNAWLWQL